MKPFKTMEHGTRHKRVVFMMGGWSYRLFYLWPVAKLLAFNGFHCISYCYDYDVLSPDYVKTRQSMLAITDDVLRRIAQLKKQGKADFAIFGTSLGTVPAVLVANKLPEVSKVVLNTTSSDMAKTIWSWDNIKAGFKQTLLNNNITLQQLIKEWKPISPIYNIDNFKDKKVLALLVTKDVVTPYKLGQELVSAMRAKSANVEVALDEQHVHSVSGLLNLVKPRLYMRFLKDW